MFFTLPLLIGHQSKLELPSPNANNYLHIDPRYLSALLTPSPSDVTMGSPSPIEIAASIDVPDAVVLRKNLQNAAGDGGELDEIREQFVNVISNNVDNGNVKHISRAYPGQAKQIIASATGVARIVDEVGALDEPMPGPSSEEGHKLIVSIDSVADKTNIGQKEVSDFRSKTEIVDVDLGSNDDHEVIVRISSNSSELASNEDRKLTIDGIARDKEALNLKSKTEIVDVDLGSSEIIMKVQIGQLSSELVPKESARSIKNAVKGKTEIGQKEALDLRSKMEIADVDLDSNDDRELIMKAHPSESSSGELRLGECCWPKREDDEVEARDRKIISEKRIIDVELGLDDKNALKETRRSSIEAITDEVNSDRSRFSKIGLEKSSKSMIKSVIDGKVSNKEIVDVGVEYTDVVKVQPVYSSHGILTLKEDRRLMIEKLTNELKIKLDEEKNKSKENSQVDKVGKDDTELTELSPKGDMKSNVEVDDVEIDFGKETADFKSDKIKYLDAKAVTSSLNVSMTSLDGRHECALSDFSVDRKDYRFIDADKDEEENMKSVYTARLNLTKDTDGQIEDATENIATSINDHENNVKKNEIQYNDQVLIDAMVLKSQKEESFTTEEIDNHVKSSEEIDQSKYIVEESLPVKEIDDKDNNLEVRERTEEIFKMSREVDKTSRTENGSELDTSSSEKRVTSCDSNLEIDGKYLKSIVNSRKSPRKIREGQVHDVDVKEHGFIDDLQALQSEAFQSSSMKMKSSEKIKKDQIYDVDVDIEEKDQIVKNREIHAEKVFQDSSKSSTITKNHRKVDELQIDESEREMKSQDKSISDRESSRSRKSSQKSSKISTSAKSSKKKSQIFYRGEDMKDYDRSINDRVITQLEEIFLDSSKKSSVKMESSKKDSESELKQQNRHADNRETSRVEEHSQHSSKTKSPKKTQTQKVVKMNDNREQETKTMKNADNKTKCDFNEIKDVYTRKVRRYNVPLQGSLDSMIVSDETSAQKPKKDDAFSKKSKSYESIKRIQEVFLGVPPKADSSGSQLDIPDDFCSICCYMNEITFRTEDEVSSPNQETFYTLRSTCSSLADDDDDSIECDICGSLNLQDQSVDDLEGKIQEIPCELCKICGEVDGSFDQDSALPTDRYTFKMIEPHQDDDDSFEIENCGFQSGTESADDRSRLSDKEKVKDPGKPKSQSLFIHGSSMNRDQPRELYFIPKDEIAILTSGTRKVNRKGSLFRKKEDFNGSARDKRRYSSVDSLQLAKMSSKANDKVLNVAKNTTLIGSADNLSRDSKRSKSLQRSGDDVDRLNKSTDNLKSQTENLEKENEAEDSTQKLNIRDKEEVKMILTQHGIKIISEKETAL